MSQYQVSCFCGSVCVELEGEPEVMAYCHCDSCRHWSAGPVNAFTLWQPDKVRIVKGEDQLIKYDKNVAQKKGDSNTERQSCKVCGGHVLINHPPMNLIDIPAVIIEGLTFTPAFHVNYVETVLPMKDGLPKFKDLPEPAGGSGEEVPE